MKTKKSKLSKTIKDVQDYELSPCCNAKLVHYDRSLLYCSKCRKDYFYNDISDTVEPIKNNY